ncbi:iron complex outermembrane receptor protein [Variovorax boronicumulans]|uniref:TonB-dependent receptor n=1 Tax=Variovorax boronicumulans TaxID=436515 RepID=UPI002780431A|nr:TonB-dependent receptor [Variovorax boronicumulans]MDP9994211.1 iron complex outermembrane receptor protein [Variovorax boronicumulans]MDQ0001698.1 iron complex outermembrane receptor protein [Variovorax boronicumulans]
MPAVSSLRLRPTVAASLLALHALGAMAQTPAAEPAASSGTLATVNVEASADASAEGLTKPYAGGQVARGGRVGILGNQDMMSTPFSGTSYTADLIQDQQAKSVADVLLNNPSIRQARGFGNFQELYMVRGFQLGSDDISYNGLYGMLPRQYVASELFERVEVFLGASTFLNGAAPAGSGIGGAINLLPKRASSEPITRINTGIQSGGQAFVSTDIARRFGPDQSTGIRLNAVRRDGGTGVDGEKRELSAFGLGFDWHSRNVRLSADLGFQDHEIRGGRPNVTPAANLPIPAAPDARKNYAQPWSFSKERDTFVTARGEVDITDNVMAWAAFGARRGTESNALANPTLKDAFGNLSSSRFDNVRKDEVSTGEIGVRGKFQTGPVGHSVTVSAAMYDNKRRNAYATSPTGGLSDNLYTHYDSFMPLTTTSPTVGGNMSDPLLQSRYRSKSIAIADTMSFLDDRLLVTIGARRQNIDQDTYSYGSGLPQSGYESARTTPVAGVVFKATNEISVYANYIEALLPGETAPVRTSSGQAVLNAGTVFAPYRSKQKEIGVKYDGGSIGGSISAFSTDQPQYYVQNGSFGANGEQRNQGVELSLFGEPVKGLRVLGGLTWLDAEQRHGATDGKTAIGVPKTQLNLGAEWDVPGVRGFALNARVIHTTKQYANATNTQVIPGWTRVDAGARYIVDIGNGRALTLRARIDNLFNKSYWSSTGGYPGSNYLVLGNPRTFSVSGTIDF